MIKINIPGNEINTYHDSSLGHNENITPEIFLRKCRAESRNEKTSELSKLKGDLQNICFMFFKNIIVMSKRKAKFKSNYSILYMTPEGILGAKSKI